MKYYLFLFFSITLLAAANSQNLERYKKLDDTLFFSKALGFDKKLSIIVPIEFQKNDSLNRFPLIILFDSQNQRSYNYIINTIDYLTSNEQMPSSVIIGVESTQEKRYGETQLEISDKEVFGSKNENFIMEELTAFARKELQVKGFITLIGHSRYGYFTSYLLTKYPEKLNAVISLSPFTIQKNVNLSDSIATLYANYSSKKHLYYRFGIGQDYPENFEELDTKLAKVHTPSKAANFNGQFYPEADHNVTPGLRIATALFEVFEFWSKQQNKFMKNELKDFSSLKQLSENIQQHYGADLSFSLGTLNGKGWYFFGEGEFEKAIQAWELMLLAYPNFADGYFAIIEAKKELKQDYSEVLKKLKTCLSTTEFYSKEELIELLKEFEKL